MTATLTKWYEEHGRHEIFAGGKNVALSTADHSLVLDAGRGRASASSTTSTTRASPRRRAKRRCARGRAKKKTEENERMAALYRQHVLKEEPAGPVLQIQGLGGKKKDTVQEVLHKDEQ